MKRMFLVIAAAAFAVMTSCAETPADIKDKDGNGVSIYDNFTLAENVSVPTVNSVRTYSFVQAGDMHEKFDELRSLFISDDVYSVSDCVWNDGEYPNNYFYMNESGQNLVLAPNGFFSYVSTQEYPEISESRLELTVFLCGDYDDVEITLDGRKDKLSTAVANAEQYLKSVCDIFGQNCATKLQYAKIYKLDNGDNYLRFRAPLCFDGILVNSVSDLSAETENSDLFWGFEVGMTAFDSVCFMDNVNGGVIIPESSKEIENPISCDEALKIASDYLSENGGYTVYDIELENFLTVESYEDTWGDWNIFMYQCGAKYSSQAYWAFYFSVADNAQKICYVNAQTGEPFILFNND